MSLIELESKSSSLLSQCEGRAIYFNEATNVKTIVIKRVQDAGEIPKACDQQLTTETTPLAQSVMCSTGINESDELKQEVVEGFLHSKGDTKMELVTHYTENKISDSPGSAVIHGPNLQLTTVETSESVVAQNQNLSSAVNMKNGIAETISHDEDGAKEMLISNDGVDDVDLESLRQKVKSNSKLKRFEMMQYAWVLNRACLAKHPLLTEYRLKDSVTPEEFLMMDPVPNCSEKADSKITMSNLNSCIPSVALLRMKIEKPKVKLNCKKRNLQPRCKVMKFHLVELLLDLRSNSTFHFFASTEQLAKEAAAAKYLQLELRNIQLPKKLLWNFILKSVKETPLLIFRTRKPLLDIRTLTVVPQVEKRVKGIDYITIWEVRNRKLRKQADDLEIQLKRVQKAIKRKSGNLTNLGSLAGTSANAYISSESSWEALKVLKRHPFVNSIDSKYIKDSKTKKRGFELIINDLYVFNASNFTDSSNLPRFVAEKAKHLIETIEKRGCEDVIPYEQRLDTKLLVAILELKTGLSIENITIKFKFEVETLSWNGQITIDGVSCETNTSQKTHKEALNCLILNYLIEKQSCMLMMP